MLRNTILVCLLAICWSVDINAQVSSNLFRKNIWFASDTVQLDTNSIVFNSVEINDSLGEDIEVDHVRGRLIWKGQNLPTDSIMVRYRAFSFSFVKPYFHKDSEKLKQLYESNNQAFKINIEDSRPSVFDLGYLNKTGSISRGIMVGNNQDLSVNSNLNLELTGNISHRFKVVASISDDNIPIQPEGNTQQLQDFDQVFIKVYDDFSSVRAGDFWLKNGSGYFMRYNKRAQGASITTRILDPFSKSGLQTKAKLSGAISKGKFARNVIQGVEGNQGPYRLRGSEGEAFVIILSGTESVYIDGKELKRGQANDYTIDYNTAEVTFTTNQLITKDRRIVVEFQYSDKNYARSLVQFGNSWEKENWDINLGIYSEQDAKNQPLQQELSLAQQQFLAQVGDSIHKAFYAGVDSVEYSANQVLYSKLDSLGYSIYRYSTNPDSAKFRLTFSNVGAKNGNYVQADFSAQGRVFRWVAPDTINGVIHRNGNYEPVRVLVTPKKRQLVTLNSNYRFSDKLKLFVEGAISNFDANTFSRLDRSDNVGDAWKTRLAFSQPLDTAQYDPLRLVLNLDLERMGRNFNSLERFRSVEFSRNWNVRNVDFVSDQHIAAGQIGLAKKSWGEVLYGLDYYQVGQEYLGLKNNLNALVNKSGYSGFFEGSYLNTTGFRTSNFIRHKSLLEKKTKWFGIGFQDEHERNLQFSRMKSDSLADTSYQFYDWRVFVKNGDSAKIEAEVFYRNRFDRKARNNALMSATNSDHIGFSAGLLNNTRNTLQCRLEYRSLVIQNDELTNQKPDKTMIGRLDYSLNLLKKSVRLTTYYEVGSGLELKRQFAYLQVQPGQGVYVWNDYDNDSVKGLNEFEVAAFGYEADHIRVFTPTNEYVRTYTNQLAQTLILDPKSIWRVKLEPKTRTCATDSVRGRRRRGLVFRRLMSKFYNQTSFSIDRKTNSETIETRFNSFLTNIDDATLISLASSWRNTLFFNRTNSKFGVDYTFLELRNKTLLTNGFEGRLKRSHEMRSRWNVRREYAILLDAEYGEKVNTSDYTSGREYDINYYSIKPSLSYQPSTEFKLSLLGRYSIKKNKPNLGGQFAQIMDVGTEARFNKVRTGMISGNLNFINIVYTGENSGSISYEMLEALNPGRNFTWTVAVQRNLSSNLQLSINYSGRKSEENNAIHAGGIQLRAFF